MQNILKIVCVVTLCVINQSAFAMFCKLLGRCPEQTLAQQKLREQEQEFAQLKQQQQQESVQELRREEKRLLLICLGEGDLFGSRWEKALEQYVARGFESADLGTAFRAARGTQVDKVLKAGYWPSVAGAAAVSPYHLKRFLEVTGYKPKCEDFLIMDDDLFRSKWFQKNSAEVLHRYGADCDCMDYASLAKSMDHQKIVFAANHGKKPQKEDCKAYDDKMVEYCWYGTKNVLRGLGGPDHSPSWGILEKNMLTVLALLHAKVPIGISFVEKYLDMQKTLEQKASPGDPWRYGDCRVTVKGIKKRNGIKKNILKTNEEVKSALNRRLDEQADELL